jgi:multicomponent Na+:H+ antiporter subunit A
VLLLLLAAHAAVGVAVLAAAPRLGRWGFLAGATPMAASLAYAAARWDDVVGGAPVVSSQRWVAGLELVVDARLDGFALVMVLLVSGMGVAVMAYSPAYFGRGGDGGRVAGLLVLFAGSMLALVLADNLGWLYVSWELTSVLSFLLIGGAQVTPEQRAAARQALLVTASGGLAMLGGFVLIAQAAGTWSLHQILTDPPSGPRVHVGLGLVLAGVVTKSAQFPFHFWLPGAMVAPTPISAYLHSATMVKAGIYLAARLAPAFALVGFWRPVVIGVGLFTMIGGALRALRQTDLKLLLAFGTVSQLGFMLVLAGAGRPEATKAAVVLLLAHGLFKGALFLVVGIVDHELGTRDVDALPRLAGGWRGVRVVAILSAASMAGVPPLVGFVAKESAYEAFAHGSAADSAVLAGLVAGSVLTFAYSARFIRPFLPGRDVPAAAHGPSTALAVAPVVLVAGTVLGGLAVPVLDPLVRSAANALDPGVGEPKLALWHGFNLPLALSAVTIVLGLVLVTARRRVGTVQAALAPPVRAEQGYTLALRALDVTARRVTGAIQVGSLPAYIAVILVVVIGVPNVVLLRRGEWPGWPALAEVAGQPVLAAVLIGAGVAVAFVRRRFGTVLLLGAVGYTMAVLFALQGAADLALTQFAVETLSVVVFMLVIRHLPREFRRYQFRAAGVLRLTVAVFVGVGVFALAMMTGGGTAERPVSDQIVAAAEPEGGGRNVVNIILVDVRGLDTLGEITVLTASAVGVASLARIGRRPTERQPRGERPS